MDMVFEYSLIFFEEKGQSYCDPPSYFFWNASFLNPPNAFFVVIESSSEK